MTGQESTTTQTTPSAGVPTARRIIDLSLRIESHFRWEVELDLAHDLQKVTCSRRRGCAC